MDGEQLLKYQGDLERILCVCVRLRCKRAYTLACNLLEHTLRSVSLIYPTEYRSTSGGFDTDLPIRVKKKTEEESLKKRQNNNLISEAECKSSPTSLQCAVQFQAY